MTFRHLFENPIRLFALLCVAATSGYIAYIDYWLIQIMSSPGWCAKAIQAERITPGNSFQGLTGCIDILKLQVGSLAKVLLIGTGTFALCLGVLVVIVIAGARLSGKIFGNEIDIDRLGTSPAARAATTTAAAAVGAANKIVEETSNAGKPDAQSGGAPEVRKSGGVGDDSGTAHPDLGSG